MFPDTFLTSSGIFLMPVHRNEQPALLLRDQEVTGAQRYVFELEGQPFILGCLYTHSIFQGGKNFARGRQPDAPCELRNPK